MDADDMRSFSLLDSAVRLVGRSENDGASQDIFSSGNELDDLDRISSLRPDSDSLLPLCDDNNAFSEALAKETRFTVDEVKQKLAGFSGDRGRAKEFLIQCRQAMDDLFRQSFDGPSSISQA